MKFRAIHLLSDPKQQREQRSIAEVSQLIRYGVEYFAVINPAYEGELPEQRPANDRGFELLPAHFGCYCSHKYALNKYFDDDLDALLVFECDCLFVESVENFYWRIVSAYDACLAHGLQAFTFGPKHGGQTIDDLGDNRVTTTRIIETHALMIPIGAREQIREIFDLPFDAADFVYTVYGYDRRKYRYGIFNDRPHAVQASGMSIVDGKMKDSEHYFRALTHQN